MRPHLRFQRAAVLLTLLLAVAAAPARAQSLRVIATDERGVTLRLDLPSWRLAAAHPDPFIPGQRRAEIMAPGLAVTGVPGRPLVPFAQALIALPPGAGATARVVDGAAEEARDSVRLAICGRPGVEDDRGGMGPTPVREPVPAILDGPWPATPVVVGAPFTVRRQRMAAVQVWPFRYDEATNRLWSRRTLTVRVDFTGLPAGGAPSGAQATDRHWEPVFQSALANYEQGRAWRAPRRPAAGLFDRAALPAAVRSVAAFDESEPEVRVRVDTTGVYALAYDDLAAQGYPAGVPVGEVSLHRHEYVGTADPPYVTIEIPVEIADWNANGVFDSGDWILAYVQSWVDRSGVTSYMQRNWGDGDMVFATRLAGGAGKRMTARAGWRDQTLSPLASYPWTQRWERRFSYFRFPSPLDTATSDRFMWVGTLIDYYSRPDSLRFETNGLDTTHTVAFRVLMQGRDNTAHVMFGRVKNGLARATMVMDSTTATWYQIDPLTVTATLPGGALTEGNTNTFAIWGKGNASPPDPVNNFNTAVGLNWFEATYWRAYRALGGYLAASSADADGPYQVHGTGFGSAGIRVYDVTDGASPVRLDLDPSHIAPDGLGGYAVDFQDSTAAPAVRRYVAFDTPKFLPAGRYSPVTRRHLTANTGEQDYLLICPEAFLAATPALAALRRAQGLSVLVAPLESINDEFNGGRKSMYSIKRFLRYAYDNWNTRFVTLLGDGSCDGANVLATSGRDWLPVPLVPGAVPGGIGLELIPADPWYGWCVDDDPACTGPDSLREPEIYVGRLPVNSLQQANDVVAKLVTYESFDSTQTWRRRMTLLSDDCYSSTSTFGGGGTTSGYCYRYWEEVFRMLSEACAAIISGPSGAGMSLAQPEVLDLRSWLTDPTLYDYTPGATDTCRVGISPQTRCEGILRANFNPVLFGHLSAGALWWNWQGHANQTVLSHEGFYKSLGPFAQDCQNFMNDDKLFLFTAFSCHANAFALDNEGLSNLGPSLGETMLTLPRRGAVASWASSGFELVPSSGTYHLNTELTESLFATPPHDDERGFGITDNGARVVLGEAIALTLLRYLPVVRQISYERAVGLSYNLLGDPATRLWVGPAQISVTANGEPVTNGQPVRLGSLGDTLRLEADLVSNVQIVDIALDRLTAQGATTVTPDLYTLTPPFPDTSAGGAGGRRFHLSYATTLGAGPLHFTLRIRDRWGVTSRFEVVFEFRTQLYAEDAPLADGDNVAADARLGLLVLSPSPLTPDSLHLFVDNSAQAFSATPARGDTSDRQWMLTWTHAPYADGPHTVRLEAPGAQVATHTFRVVSRFALRDVYAFPNPFDDELGTRFVFTLDGDAASDLLVRVFTASGRRVYETRLGSLPPGHHEIPWNGRDEEGEKLANGIYFYKVVAHGSAGTSSYDGRLVKLRRPKRAPETSASSGP